LEDHDERQSGTIATEEDVEAKRREAALKAVRARLAKARKAK
jgi:hypothetical protein